MLYDVGDIFVACAIWYYYYLTNKHKEPKKTPGSKMFNNIPVSVGQCRWIHKYAKIKIPLQLTLLATWVDFKFDIGWH